MAEGFLIEFANSQLDRLIAMGEQEIVMLWNVGDEVRQLKNTKDSIQALLKDASQQELNYQNQHWIQKLKEVLLDVEDLADDFDSEIQKRERMRGNKVMKEVCVFFSGSNKLIYRHKLGKKLKSLRTRLDEIANNKEKHALPVNPQSKTTSPTISPVSEVVIGRNDDKEAIIKWLLGSKNEEKVISVVGLGGMGKTTLAQLVFNDREVGNNFNEKLWVSVPHRFDLKLILQKILESITKTEPGNLDPNNLSKLIGEKLKEKKYLLVLDDVWNDNEDMWDNLKKSLNCGESGSKIILTTRMESVAQRSHAHIHKLRELSDSESWDLLKQLAFSTGNVPIDLEHLVEIGKEIASNCLGVPLVITVVGRLLRDLQMNEWLSFKEEKLSTIAQDEDGVLMRLKLSYDNLPGHLQDCFSYCCLLPKGCEIDVETLIQLWIANGLVSFVGKSRHRERLEDIGYEIFKELCGRSFFQEVKETFGDPTSCRMHDLMHDLANSVAGRKAAILSSPNEINVDENTCYVSFDFNIDASWQIPSSLFRAKKLRTWLLLKQKLHSNVEGMSDSTCEDIFSNFKRLRVLDLHDLGINTVSSSIKKLKHLRYLDASNNDKIETLSDSMTKLPNLAVLKLFGCTQLKELPTHVTKLIDLRYLDCKDCWNLTHMPRGLGKLTSLQTLTWFVVAKDSINSKHVAGLEELAKLNKLRFVEIRNLRFVKDPKSAADAKLQDKQHLRSLTLSWNSEAEDIDVYSDYKQRSSTDIGHGNMDAHNNNVVDQQILESLEPNRKLKRLKVYEFGGKSFPNWLSSIKNLMEIWIVNCAQLQQLPSLDQLPFLRDLWLSELTNLVYINKREHENRNVSFGSLKSLRIWCCPNLDRWWKSDNGDCNREDGIQQPIVELPIFPCLLKLEILSCPKMTWSPFSFDDGVLEFEGEDLSRLQRTSPSGKVRFLNCLSSFSSLKRIEVFGCRGCRYFPPLNRIPSLEEISFQHVGDLEYIGIENEGSNFFPSLEKLSIKECRSFKGWRNARNDYNEVSGLPQFVTVVFPKLKELVLYEVDDLTHLGIEDSPLLEKIDIYDCKNLKSLLGNKGNENTATTSMSEFPEFPALTILEIDNCPNFTCSANNNTMKTLDLKAMSFTNLKKLSLEDLPDLEFIDTKILPLLEELTIVDCPNLKGLRNKGNEMLELHKFPTLRELKIDNLPNFRFSVNGNTNLEELALGNLPSLEFICIDTLPLLKNLKITRCPNLKGFEKLRSVPFSPLLVTLSWRDSNIEGLEKLINMASKLELLFIDNMRDVESLPSIQHLKSLKELYIFHCEKLKSLPEGIKDVTSLVELYVGGCPLLSERYREKDGVDWRSIARIPRVIIY